jgi:hypothetical protein
VLLSHGTSQQVLRADIPSAIRMRELAPPQCTKVFIHDLSMPSSHKEAISLAVSSSPSRFLSSHLNNERSHVARHIKRYLRDDSLT